jgi:hypothetical protein
MDLEATDDGHLSGFVNFYGNQRPDGFRVGEKFSIITDDPRAQIVQQFLHITIRFVDARTAQVQGYIDGSRAQFQNVNTVAKFKLNWMTASLEWQSKPLRKARRKMTSLIRRSVLSP